MSTIVVFRNPCVRKQAKAAEMSTARVSTAVACVIGPPSLAYSVIGREDQTACRNAGARGHEHVLDVVHLIVRRAAHLTDTFGDSVHAVDVGLAEQSAVGVDRHAAPERQLVDRHEVLGFAATAEPQFLELSEDE